MLDTLTKPEAPNPEKTKANESIRNGGGAIKINETNLLPSYLTS